MGAHRLIQLQRRVLACCCPGQIYARIHWYRATQCPARVDASIRPKHWLVEQSQGKVNSNAVHLESARWRHRRGLIGLRAGTLTAGQVGHREWVHYGLAFHHGQWSIVRALVVGQCVRTGRFY